MTLPLADARAFRRVAVRTRAIRLGLAALLAVLVATAFALADGGARPAQVAKDPALNTEIVLDVSGSVTTLTRRPIASALRQLAAGPGTVGLVAFSDTAYEMLPPGTPARELLPLVRFFTQRQDVLPAPLHPWSWFTGGTVVASGLDAARRALLRDGLAGRVLLISDLADSNVGEQRLEGALIAVARIADVRVLALPGADPGTKRRYAKIVGADSVYPAAELRPLSGRSGGIAFPFGLVTLAAAVALALAAHELLAVSLRWRAARA